MKSVRAWFRRRCAYFGRRFGLSKPQMDTLTAKKIPLLQ